MCFLIDALSNKIWQQIQHLTFHEMMRVNDILKYVIFSHTQIWKHSDFYGDKVMGLLVLLWFVVSIHKGSAKFHLLVKLIFSGFFFFPSKLTDALELNPCNPWASEDFRLRIPVVDTQSVDKLCAVTLVLQMTKIFLI